MFRPVLLQFFVLMFVAVTTLYSGYLNITRLFYPMLLSEQTQVQGIVTMSLTVVIMGSVIVVILDALPKWIASVRWASKSILRPTGPGFSLPMHSLE